MKKSIPTPDSMAHLPIDKRGFPVPVIIKNDKDGIPNFKINDSKKVLDCITKKLCTVCGKPLGDDKWLVGGIISAFHPYGAYNDAPMHKICVDYSMQMCPYLANTKYVSTTDVSKIDLSKFDDDVKELGDNTMTSDRLQFFVVVKIKSLVITLPQMLIKPLRPYEEIEYWKDGNVISREDTYKLDGNAFALWNNYNRMAILNLW
jgi:hypothetical protein